MMPKDRDWIPTLILNLTLAAGVGAAYTIYTAQPHLRSTPPNQGGGYSRHIVISFHGTALIEGRRGRGLPNYRLTDEVCGHPLDNHSGCYP